MSITLDEVRAEALFAGDLQPSQHPRADLVRLTVAATLRRYGSQGCAARMAQEFGDHPEAAAQRMAWALHVVQDCYARSIRVRTRCLPTQPRPPARPDPADRVERIRCPYPTNRYRDPAGRGDHWC
jgi:hypothetical protein